MTIKSILAVALGTTVVLIGLAALVGLAVVNRPPSDLEKIVILQATQENAVRVFTAGCTIAGVNDPGFGPVINQSHGQVCIQVGGENLVKLLDGRGECKLDDKKCIFTLGYALTKMRGLQEMPDGPAGVDKLQEEINTFYEKLNSTKEKQ